jgi:lipid A 4'-phosphatase
MMAPRGAAVYALIVAAALALFLLAPQVDLQVSALFYQPQHGFALRDREPLSLIYHLIPWVAWGIVAVVAAATAWLFLMQRPLWRFDRKALLFLALSTLLGPGLLANTVLKDHWGRARPTQIEAFGGAHHFTPAPLPAAECRRNCSFVSGHAALGFSLVAFAFLLPRGRTRRRGIAATLGFGALVGLVRVAQGGHFLSDVVWAGLLVFGIAAVLHWWIVEKDGLAVRAPIRLHLFGPRAATLLGGARNSEMARIALAVVATAILVVVSMMSFDRPVDLYLHSEGPDLHALFETTGRLGEAWGWLLLFGLGFAGLHWGGELPRLRAAAARLRALSVIPAFLFAAVAVSGLVADVLKIGFGRMRPKLLFRGDFYGFTWLAWRPDHWSFPSGHTATIVALMTALWWLWPRHLLFYILVAAIVAASRIVVGAHYPSDVIAGALIAVLSVRGVVWLFAGWGVDLEAVRRIPRDFGKIPRQIPPWPCRRWRELAARRRSRAGAAAGRPLASPATGVVSPRHGAADRDVQ